MPRIKNCKVPEILQVENTEKDPVVCVVCRRSGMGSLSDSLGSMGGLIGGATR